MSNIMDPNISTGDDDFPGSSFASDDGFIHAASHAFEDGPNSSDADKSRNSKEGLGIPKANFDQLNEQEKREMGQRVRSQDNIYSDDEMEGKKAKKYKSGKGKLQKMGNVGNRSTSNGTILYAVIIGLVCLIVNV